MMSNYTKIFAFLVILFILPINNGYSHLNQINILEGLKNFITQQIKAQHITADLDSINIKILDQKNIKNKTCNNKVNYYFPTHSHINKRATIVVECTDFDSWKLYLPVTITFFANVISTTKPLPRFHIINQEDLTRKKINVLQLKEQYYINPKDIIGLSLKHPVKSNTVLTSGLLQKVSYES